MLTGTTFLALFLSTTSSTSSVHAVAAELLLASAVPLAPSNNFFQARDSIASIATVTSEEELQVALPPTETRLPGNSFLPQPGSATTSDEGSENDTLPIPSAPIDYSGSRNGVVVSPQVGTASTPTEMPRTSENFQFTFTTPRPSPSGGLIAMAKNILSVLSPWNVQPVRQGGATWSY